MFIACFGYGEVAFYRFPIRFYAGKHPCHDVIGGRGNFKHGLVEQGLFLDVAAGKTESGCKNEYDTYDQAAFKHTEKGPEKSVWYAQQQQLNEFVKKNDGDVHGNLRCYEKQRKANVGQIEFPDIDQCANDGSGKIGILKSDEHCQNKTDDAKHFLDKAISESFPGKKCNKKDNDGVKKVHLDSRSSRTTRLTRVPSALPLTFGIRAPITLPISDGEEASVLPITSDASERISSSDIISGR